MCTGAPLSAHEVALLANGDVPRSPATGPLAAGAYGFVADYSGDSNYQSASSSCQPFFVNKGGSSVAATVYDAATRAPWTGQENEGPRRTPWAR